MTPAGWSLQLFSSQYQFVTNGTIQGAKLIDA
jgi:hypothetical protein